MTTMWRCSKLHLVLVFGLLACGEDKGGGKPGTGGAISTGGTKGTGGSIGSGGAQGMGGSTASGGAQGSGGKTGTGGATTGSGGKIGTTGTGGATAGSGGSTGRDAGLAGTGGGAGSTGTSGRDASQDISIVPDTGPGLDGNRAFDTALDADGGQVLCPSGWTLAWSDEFGGAAGATADSGKWVYETGNGSGGWGNNELEYYRSQNGVTDGNGNLVITAKKETVSGFDYTSARMKTQGLATFTYGRIEARIKLPIGKGIWPAFWMLGSDINTNTWPACGEIDVMENLGSEPTKVHGTIHGPGYSAGSGPTATYTLPGTAKLADDFHVFTIEWEQEVIRWYVDGSLYSTKAPKDIGSGNTWVFNKPFFILLNLAVGGGWPGSPDSTTVFPQTMTVDYVRVCQR